MTEAEPLAPAASPTPRWRLFASIAIVVVVIDQLTKAWLVSILDPGQSLAIVGDWLRLVHGQNSGALFGLFRDSAAGFAIVSVVVIGAILWYEARAGGTAYVSLTLGLLFGGALGNLADRIRLGYVVDFVDAGIGPLRFWTFNVADASISLAIVLLLAASVWPSLAGQRAVRSGA
ncbi:MAG TPA: signal peptidase II [Candidatus Polarisedimenticolia bacterium]|nr:signal peptidase II [Candidatus Polarisedimenticolia bacterium]